MTKTRFTPWIVLACIGTLAGCSSGEGGTAGNTELNVIIPSGGGSSAPNVLEDDDIQVVEYTIYCDAPSPTASDFPGINSIEPNANTFNPDVTINGVLEVLDSAHPGVPGGLGPNNWGPTLGEVYVWQGFMDIPHDAVCTAQLRARDDDGEVICTATTPFETTGIAVGGKVKVNVLMICDISFQYPVAMVDLDGDFQFNISNFCPDLFVLNCIDTDIDVRSFPAPIGDVAATACQVRARDGDNQCGDSCDPQSCVMDTAGLTCTAAPEPMICSANSDNGDAGMPCTGQLMCNGLAANAGDLCTQESDCTPIGGTSPPVMCDSVQCELPGTCVLRGIQTTVACAPVFVCAIPGALFGTSCVPAAGDFCFDNSGGMACVPNAVIDCTGTNTPAASCVFNGDVLGMIGAGPPGPLNPGEGGFFVACVLADDDGLSSTPDVPVTPGATITCTATTTDGDDDCTKIKFVNLTCPGLTPCQNFGGDTACQLASTSVCQAGTCVDAGCDGTNAFNCCDYAAVPDGPTPVDCSSECAMGEDCELSPGLCEGGVCVSQDCNAVGCPADPNECQEFQCQLAGNCLLVDLTGEECNSQTGICLAGGVCQDNCAEAGCVEGDPDCDACADTGGDNPCTNNVCTSTAGGNFECANPNDDTNTCVTGEGTPACTEANCICEAGNCVAGCNTPAAVDAPGILMACRNSFNQAVSTFPIDLLNVQPDTCITEGDPFNTDIDVIISLDTAFLEAAAQTLCDLGTLLTSALITDAQVSVNALPAGATCTEQLTELPDASGTSCTDDGDCTAPERCDVEFSETCQNLVTVATECDGDCGDLGVICEVTAGIALPLPDITVPCSAAGTAGSEVQFCSTGEVPLTISLTDPPPPPAYTETYVGVEVGGGAITVAFACNTSSTTNPAPGIVNEIGCVATNPTQSTPDAQSCEEEVGDGNVGETPFPTSDCNTADGPPTDPGVCNAPCDTSCDLGCNATCDTGTDLCPDGNTDCSANGDTDCIALDAGFCADGTTVCGIRADCEKAGECDLTCDIGGTDTCADGTGCTDDADCVAAGLCSDLTTTCTEDATCFFLTPGLCANGTSQCVGQADCAAATAGLCDDDTACATNTACCVNAALCEGCCNVVVLLNPLTIVPNDCSGTCDTVPRGVAASTQCATFPVLP